MWFRRKIAVDNLEMEIPKDMLWCFEDEYYEKNVIYWIGKIAEGFKRPVIYDVGANYGYFSIKFSGIAGFIYAFEPVSRTYKVLDRNIRKNELNNVKAFNFGLSDKEGPNKIYLYSSSGNNSQFRRTLPENHALKYTGDEIINLIRLDDLVERECLLPPDIMKIDIEGAELFALQGAKQIITKYKPFIVMEYSKNTSEDAGYAAEDLLEELAFYRYRVYGLPSDANDMTVYKIDEFPNANIANIVATPNDSCFV